MKISPQVQEFEERKGEFHPPITRDVKQKIEANSVLYLPLDVDYIEANNVRQRNFKRLIKTIK